MMTTPTRLVRSIAMLASICTISLGFAQAAFAGVIGTESISSSARRAAQVDTIQNTIMSDQVSAQLVALGVDPGRAAERVASMTDEELARLNDHIAQMPAGAGIVEIIGVVFIVLLILEFTGVIDIFKKPSHTTS